MASKVQIFNISDLHIKGINFFGCQGNLADKVDKIVLEDTMFSNHNGTALELSNCIMAHITGSAFVLNKGSNYHGPTIKFLPADHGAAISAVRCVVRITDSGFEANSAKVGGAIFGALYSNITIVNSTFVKNHASIIGGALYTDSNCTVNIYNTTFKENKVEEDLDLSKGGVMYVRDSFVTIVSCTLSSNVGRAIFADTSSLSLNNTQGVMHAKYNNRVNVVDCQISSNSADLGAFMYTSRNTTIFVSGWNFTNNTANKGGVFNLLVQININITNCRFSNNSASWGGV